MLACSVIIPIYNALPVLPYCLQALCNQELSAGITYEIILIDDGSTDGSAEWLAEFRSDSQPWVYHAFPTNQGRAKARNQGIRLARSPLIIFIDSDVLVCPTFIQGHLASQTLTQKAVCQGPLILTHDFEHPQHTPWALWTDFSRAFFATGNASVARQAFDEVGLFDETFTDYGWEDLELGLRLKQAGYHLCHQPQALGYHWERPFSPEQLPALIAKEKARGRGAVHFFRKHPTLEVRLMTQLTPLHRFLDFLVTGGGRWNEQSYLPLVDWLEQRGHSKLALALLRGILNHYNLEAIREAMVGKKS